MLEEKRRSLAVRQRGHFLNRGRRNPLAIDPTFDESKMASGFIVNPIAKVAKIKQNVLEAAESARKSPGQKVFDGKP